MNVYKNGQKNCYSLPCRTSRHRIKCTFYTCSDISIKYQALQYQRMCTYRKKRKYGRVIDFKYFFIINFSVLKYDRILLCSF